MQTTRELSGVWSWTDHGRCHSEKNYVNFAIMLTTFELLSLRVGITLLRTKIQTCSLQRFWELKILQFSTEIHTERKHFKRIPSVVMTEYRVKVIGSGGVGKSALTVSNSVQYAGRTTL